MAALLLLSRVLGQVRDTVISIVFGSNQYVDAYRAAFSIPDLLFFLIAGGALSSAFIPVFSEYLAKDNEEEAWRIFSTLATLIGLIVLLFVIGASIWTEPLVRWTAPGLPDETRPLTVAMARILLPAQFGFFLGGLMFGTMNARNHFLIPGLSPSLYNVGIICGALVIAHFVPVPVFGLAWGALLGAVIGNLVIPLILLPRFGGKYRFELNLRHPGVVAVFRLMLPVVLGLSLPGIYTIVMRGFASHFQAGIINDLELSNRLMQAPLGILGQGFAIAVFPTLSTLYALSKREEFLAVLNRTLQTVLYLTIFVSAAMFFFSFDIVRVLNEYGKFTPEHTEFTARGLQMFSIGIFAWCAHPVLMRAYFAIRNTWTPVLLGSLTTAVFFGLCFFLTTPELGLGYRGLPLASSLAAILLFVLMLVGLRWQLGRIDGKALARLVPLSALLAVISAGAGYGLASLIPPGEGIYNNLASGLRLFFGGLAGFWAYLYLGRLFRLKEAEYALTVLLRKRAEVVAPEASEAKEAEDESRQS